MPTSLKQSLTELASQLEQQNHDWQRVRLALQRFDPASRIAVNPELLDELEQLCRPQTHLVLHRNGVRG